MAVFRSLMLLVCLAAAVRTATSRQLLDAGFIDNGGNLICSKQVGQVNTVFSNGLPGKVKVAGDACSHFYRGWDVTGVVNEFDLTVADGIHHSCDCVRECVKRIGVCMAWVWKFTGDASGQRTCTLYSQFNLPPQVTLGYDLAKSKAGKLDNKPHNTEQFGHIQTANVVQPGSTIPQCMTNDGKQPDPGCKSGMVTIFGDNTITC